jgi:hypothetical protein
MFEKYKNLKQKRNHFGMSKKEYYKLIFLAFIAVACFAVLAYSWSRPASPPGTEVKIPKEDPNAGLPMKVEKAGDKGAKFEFQEELEKRRKKRVDTAAEPEEIKVPEIPRPPTPWKQDSEIWKQVDDAALDQLEWQVALYALHRVNSMTQEEIRKKVAEDNVAPADFMEHPAEHRGKFVSITGTLINMENQVLDQNRSGIGQYWDGLIYNQRHKSYRRFYYFIFEKDREWVSQQAVRNQDLTRNGDLVTLSGIFIKLYRNTTQGGQERIYPFIIGRKFEPARGPTVQGQYPWAMLSIVGIIFAIVFAGFFLAMHRDRKDDEAFLHSRKHKKAALVNNEKIRQAAAKAKSKGTKEEPTLDSLGTPQPGEPKPPAGKDGGPGDAPDKQENSAAPDNTESPS